MNHRGFYSEIAETLGNALWSFLSCRSSAAERRPRRRFLLSFASSFIMLWEASDRVTLWPKY